MLRGMDWWTFGGADASIASTWFGLHHARLKVVVLQRTLVSSFGCFVFEFWMLRFRVLDALFSSFGCSVFEFWVLRFRGLGTIALSIVSVPIAQRSNIHVLPSFSFILFSGILPSQIVPQSSQFVPHISYLFSKHSLRCRRILGGRNHVRVRIVVAAIFDFMAVEDWEE